MRKLRILLPLLTLIMIAGCSSRNIVEPVKSSASSTYLLQHSGVLSIAGKRMPLRGMLQLKPEQKNRTGGHAERHGHETAGS